MYEEVKAGDVPLSIYSSIFEQRFLHINASSQASRLELLDPYTLSEKGLYEVPYTFGMYDVTEVSPLANAYVGMIISILSHSLTPSR